jgi:hypothetical protein
VIAGNYQQQHGPASCFSPINVWDAVLKQNARYSLNVPPEHTTLLLLLSGELLINTTQQVQSSSVVMFARDSETKIELCAQQESRFVILTGEPLNEPIQGYGPFVMNTQQEIIQAFDDFKQGHFGQLHVAENIN